MNYENYKVFVWTDRQLKKQFKKETLEKFYIILAFLYQNGFRVNCEDEEVEEQLKLWNYFQNDSDIVDLKELYGIESDFSIGKKIMIEELYDIVKASSFCHNETDNPTIMKTLATSNWSNIKNNLDRIDKLFNSTDSEIVGALKPIKNIDDIRSRIQFIKSKIEKEIRVLTWIQFSELINLIYSIYIQFGKIKTDQHKLAIISNLNDELYGGIGGFNPITGEIKCIIGSAVWDIKSCKSAKTMTKVKTLANAILKETKTDEDEEEIKFLEKWISGHQTDDERARRVVVNYLLNGVLVLLSLKHNLNFLEDKRNHLRADAIKYEFIKILEYCNVDKEYLL